MASHTPTYIPTPNWDIPANSDLVVLGRLIKDPKDPQSKIPESGVSPILASAIYQGEKTDWETTLEKMHSGTIGLWAKCMQLVGGGLSFNQVKSSMENHRFSVLETKYFLPGDEYLSRALEDPGTRAYLQVHNWRKPVYLITGIKTARGASVRTDQKTSRSTRIELKADATTVGANVEMGPEANWDLGKKSDISYGGSTDYIFAYQLMRIMPKKKGSTFKTNKFVHGALYEKQEDEGAVELGIQDVFDIEEEVREGFRDAWEQVKDDEA
ncbi:hypothetical protein G7054_g13927 [Neopestalotiopsis clavispora]|nr:hypothetical protein G7054_g13927 [Neopestalotiopsis clavispora]